MVLPCGHTFCQACIDRLKHGQFLSCPTCRQRVSESGVKVNVSLREQAPIADAEQSVPVARTSPLKSAPDSTLSIMTYYDVHDTSGFLRICQSIKSLVKKSPGVKYFGLSLHGKVAVTKEGHANFASYMLHLRKVQDLWFQVMSVATITNMEAHGPKEQVDRLEDSLKDLVSSHWAYAEGAFFVPAKYLAQAGHGRLVTDSTLCVLVYWDIRDYARFLGGVKDFQRLTRQEEKVKYYGFCMCGTKAICREGYDCADGFLEHLANVDGPLKTAMEVADVIRVEVHGPEAEVERLREPLKSFPAVFWPYPNDTILVPTEFAAPDVEPMADQGTFLIDEALRHEASSTPCHGGGSFWPAFTRLGFFGTCSS